MKYPTLMLILVGTSQIAAVHLTRSFLNESDKKVRLTLWYKRYNHVGKSIRCERRMHRLTTSIRPNELKKVTLRQKKKYDDLKICYLMVTNPRRRNDCDDLSAHDMQYNAAFAIRYDQDLCFEISPCSQDVCPLPRNVS